MCQVPRTCESPFRDEQRSIPSHAIVQYTHDSVLLFARIYRLAGYEGRVQASARLDGVAEYPLSVDPARVWDAQPIAEDTISAQPWTGTVAELEEVGATAVARDLASRLQPACVPFPSSLPQIEHIAG